MKVARYFLCNSKGFTGTSCMNKRTEAETRMIHHALDGALAMLESCERFGAIEWAFQGEMEIAKFNVEEFEALKDDDAR